MQGTEEHRWRRDRPSPRRWASAAAALAVSVAACGDGGTGPEAPELSPLQQSHADFLEIRAGLRANLDLAPDIAPVRVALDDLGVPPVPETVRGRTLGRTGDGGGYEPVEAGGAPADGARFLIGAGVSEPFEAEGFVDVSGADGATSGPSGLAVRVEKSGETRVRYEIELDVPAPGDVRAEGFVTDGARQVRFDVRQVATVVSDGFLVELDTSFGLPDKDLEIVLDYDLVLSILFPQAFLVATFRDGPEELAIGFLQRTDNSIDGAVLRNGAEILRITDDGAGEPVFLESAETPAEPGDAEAARGLLDLALNGVEELLPYLVVGVDVAGTDPAGSWMAPFGRLMAPPGFLRPALF